MLNGRNIIYTYDGGFYGLLSVVFECYYSHTMPYDIQPAENAQQNLFCETLFVKTDIKKAERVEKSITHKISYTALMNVYHAYLSCLDGKELHILNYIHMGYKFGKALNNHLALDCVAAVTTAARRALHEAHLFTGFVRFSELEGGIYYAKINPKCFVLPLIAEHFTHRYSSMPFLIHDGTHKMCLVWNGRECIIREVNSLPRLNFSENEREYRTLWKEFFDTIEIKERHNERCQNTMLPKWYRKNMHEFYEKSV